MLSLFLASASQPTPAANASWLPSGTAVSAAATRGRGRVSVRAPVLVYPRYRTMNSFGDASTRRDNMQRLDWSGVKGVYVLGNSLQAAEAVVKALRPWAVRGSKLPPPTSPSAAAASPSASASASAAFPPSGSASAASPPSSGADPFGMVSGGTGSDPASYSSRARARARARVRVYGWRVTQTLTLTH